MSDIPDILSALTRHRMLRPGDVVLVALSGGPDSTAMTHALHASARTLDISLHAAHFNHCLRGTSSDEDARFASAFARKLDITIHIGRAPHLASLPHVSEEEARTARYEFLRRVASKVGANRIAVGHNADDRAESVLLNVFRGTGVAGLGSIRPVQGDVIRPLIDTTRRDIEDYLAEHNLAFRVDESNADTDYARNWVRHELMPLLEDRCNPNVKTALLRLAEIAADQSDAMEQLAAGARTRAQYASGMDVDVLLSLPTAVLRELIRSEIRLAKADLTDITYDQVRGILEALNSGMDFTVTLTGGEVYASRSGKSFRVYRKAERTRLKPFEVSLPMPGMTEIPGLDCRIITDIVESPEPRKTCADTALIDSESVVGSLRARNARPGDRIVPFGMTGEKKLQDVFVDKKIARRERDKAIVVADDERILWVVGIVTSEACRVTGKTRRAIRLSAEPCQ